jgi:integrase
MFLSKSNKSPYYQVTFLVNGKRTTVSTKTTNKEAAEFYLANFDPVNYKNKLKHPPQPVSAFTLSQFKEEYLNYAKLRFSKSYVERSIEPALKFLIEYAGDIPLNQLNLKTIDNFIINKFNKSKSGAALYYRTLKAAFSKAVIWNYIPENPFIKIKAPKTPKSLPLYIDDQGLQKILDNTPRQFLKDIFTIGFYSGLRLSEILNLKWTWIDFQKNNIITKISSDYSTKSKRERIIPIHKNILSILNRIKYDTTLSKNYIFSDEEGKKYNENFISKQFKKAVRLAGLDENLHMHNLRHSFCSNLVQKGVSLYVVKELAGHQQLSTSEVYSHLTHANLSSAVSLL